MLFVLAGPHSRARDALVRALAKRGVAIGADAAERLDHRLGSRRTCPPWTGGRHVCPSCDPLGYAARVLAEQRAIEADAKRGTLLLSGGATHRARLLRAIEEHKLPLLDGEPLRYRCVFAMAPPTRSLLERANFERLLYEQDGNVVTPIPRAPAREQAWFIHQLMEESLGHPCELAPIIEVARAKPRPLLRAIRKRLDHEGPVLLRVTEGFNVSLVRMLGTDRADRDRPMRWDARGYRGEPRSFADVIYATHEQEVGKPGPPTALDKLAETPDPHVLVYDATKLDKVRGREWAFKTRNRREALIVLFRVMNSRR